MRIIAGRLRHRKLLANPGNTTRPIIDRAKVMLFDRIRDRVPGARVADLFCGTGTLGLEALSRGAASVVFIERDHRAYELLRENVATLKVGSQALCWRIDLSRCSLLPKGERQWTPYNLVFFDPPYKIAGDLQPGGKWRRCLERLTRPTLTAPEALLVVRTPREIECSLPAAWQTEYEIDVASMRILLATKSAAAASEVAVDDHGDDFESGDDDVAS